jgi:hypothetical protein
MQEDMPVYKVPEGSLYKTGATGKKPYKGVIKVFKMKNNDIYLTKSNDFCKLEGSNIVDCINHRRPKFADSTDDGIIYGANKTYIYDMKSGDKLVDIKFTIKDFLIDRDNRFWISKLSGSKCVVGMVEGKDFIA